ncbi:hypothetical protein Avbf_03515 [Armadillidium vulgare]|nr:hypothetical protein Avbf_03515 [Armadillidium vulgare]
MFKDKRMFLNFAINKQIKAFPIEGPMKSSRYRVLGMTPEERAWRIQWLKDQVLSPNEPKPIPGYYQARLNPIRRFYRWPLRNSNGWETACRVRWWTGRIGLSIAAVFLTVYYFKYNTQDWTTNSGFKVRSDREILFPGDPRYPQVEVREPSDYYDFGFKNSVLYK